MPTQKDLKRLVRTRMQKTGESYTSARAQILKKSKNSKTPATTRTPGHVVPESKYAELAGMSNEAVKAKTGKTWKQWVRALDAEAAHAWPHRDIARHLHDSYDVPGWWAQMVTVGYERIRGLRQPGQRRGGGFDINKSKTVPVPVSKLYRAISTARARERWMSDTQLSVRTSTVNKSIRAALPDGTRIDFYFTDKGSRKSSVAIQHRGLATKAVADQQRAAWGERLSALADYLEASARH